MALAPLGGPGGVVIGDADGTPVGGPYSPLTGYVGIPYPYIDLVDADGALIVDADGAIMAERTEINPNLIAGMAPFFAAEIGIIGAGGTTDTLYVSDIGYSTSAPAIPYPPLLDRGFSIEARIPLAPGQVGIVYGVGAIKLINAERRYDAIVNAWNVEGQPVTVRYGFKLWDDGRGIHLDPLPDDLTTVFVGVASGWRLDEFGLSIEVRDASYWLDRALQRNLYAGTGTYEGDTELKGVPKPWVRGTVYNIPLTLIDRANLIYQYNDAAGTVLALYEGGATSITFQADTTNLYSGSTASGFYRTDNSRGLIQLGVEPDDNAGLTADVTGNFPTAGAQTIAAQIVRYIMTETMEVPAAYIDTASFDTAATDYPYPAGWYFGPGDRVDGIVAVGRGLEAFGARIVAAVSGALQCLALSEIGAETSVGAFDTANIIDADPRGIAADITPAVHRVRCAYQHNYTVQTQGLLGSATGAHRQFVQTADRYATWEDATVLVTHPSAKDLPPFGGGLTTLAHAQEVADRIGALYGQRRWSFDLRLPLVVAVQRSFGEVVSVTYPNHLMDAGVDGRIVGRGFNASDLTMTLTVLV